MGSELTFWDVVVCPRRVEPVLKIQPYGWQVGVPYR